MDERSLKDTESYSHIMSACKQCRICWVFQNFSKCLTDSSFAKALWKALSFIGKLNRISLLHNSIWVKVRLRSNQRVANGSALKILNGEQRNVWSSVYVVLYFWIQLSKIIHFPGSYKWINCCCVFCWFFFHDLCESL